jgi:hypothetical protein
MTQGIALEFSVKGIGVPERLRTMGVESILFTAAKGVILQRPGGEQEHVSYGKLSDASSITEAEVDQILIRRGRALEKSKSGRLTLSWSKTLP